MKKSKFAIKPSFSNARKSNGKGRHPSDVEDENPSHRTKKSGKRFHHRKTLKDDYWEGLTKED
ncbi:MAG: hypothetical protein SV686_12605 [Thermodesulfobacteriota bacterium]|jgi:hypothetical protein|nr:hypothetical protein [Thermodesulfobacteriota bacterium]